MSKILYFNGCSWSNGADARIECRVSSLLSNKIDYEELNESQNGKGNQQIIEETILFAHNNVSNRDDIIINVWLTSPERIWLYCDDIPFQLNTSMILQNINPHHTDEEDWKLIKDNVKKFTNTWVEHFYNQKFYLTQYVKDILLLYSTLKNLGYKFIICNSFYNLNVQPNTNLPFYEESPEIVFSDLDDDKLWRSVVSKLSEQNFLFGSVEHSIKDYLLNLWNETKGLYKNYDISQLSSIIEEQKGWFNKKPNYFFNHTGHMTELGHEKITDVFLTHYQTNNFI